MLKIDLRHLIIAHYCTGGRDPINVNCSSALSVRLLIPMAIFVGEFHRSRMVEVWRVWRCVIYMQWDEWK